MAPEVIARAGFYLVRNYPMSTIEVVLIRRRATAATCRLAYVAGPFQSRKAARAALAREGR